KMINILFFLMGLAASINGHKFDTMQSKLKEDLEIDKELKLINKTPVKSIHTKFGYIVDCIDINNQPSFDHPLLKNHKLQKKPSFITVPSKKTFSSKAIFGLQKDECPKGTVPIKRTTKEDLIRGKIYFNNGFLEHIHGNHYAEVISGYFPFYKGVTGSTSIYDVNVSNDQSSSSVMYVRNGPDSTSYIGMGWHVAPQLYNDHAAHFYAVWTTDNFKNTGCFNLQCLGFVQISRQNYLGGNILNTSIYDGRTFEMTISITQDPKTQNWWLTQENEIIGYFPISLFSNLIYAHQVGWGGRTSTAQHGPSPQMGSGVFPDNIYNHASYFIYVSFVVNSLERIEPENYMVETFNDKPKCFFAKYYGLQDEDVRYSLQFGGPGGNCGD
ncbi:protein neprosin-like, partial [Vicia villosa]|uniref:protein neprosin-like n=1 Tax=Vicia villosa TaxID=3911 RepID=UPI00273BF2C2